MSGTGTSTDRLARVLAAIDAANAADPSMLSPGGREAPLALAEGLSAHRWLLRLHPEAPGELQIAVRGHHLRRWEIPRDSFARTREGYHAWRESLYDFHADAVAELMTDTGYPPSSIERARALLHKRDLKLDADAQAHEDAVCLAFIELRLAEFLGTVEEDQLMRALRRTWGKMSAAAHDLALGMDLDAAVVAAMQHALGR